MISIIVNDTYLDLFPDTKFAVTYKFFDPTETTLRFGTYTNRIEIPRTNKNEVCFNFYGESKVSIDYDRIPCKVLSNGVEILPYGFIIIAKSDKKKYQIDLIDGAIDLYQIIENKSIKDILYIQSGWPLGGIPVPMANSDIQGYANASSGVMCPVMDYGKYVAENVDITTYLPGFSYKTVFERIFYDAGYVFQGAFRNDYYFLNRFIPYGNNQEILENPIGGVTPSLSFISELNVTPNYTVTNAELAIRTPLRFDFVNSLFKNTKGYFDGVSKITFPSSPTPAFFDADGNAINNPTSPGIIYRVKIGFSFTVTSNTGSAVDVYVRNITKGTDAYNVTLPAGASSGSFVSGDIDIMAGDVFQFQIIRNAGAPGNIVFSLGRFTFQSYSQPAPYILPDISQKEFLKEANIWFGLIWKQTLQNTLEAKSLEEILKDRGNAVDWTLKRASQDEEIDYGSSKYAQENFYKYKIADETVGGSIRASESLGLGIVYLLNRIITKVKTIYTSIWYATISSVISGSMFGKMARIPIYIGSSSRSVFDNKPLARILLTKQRTGGGSVTYTTGVSTFKQAFFEDINDSIPSGTYYDTGFKTALNNNYKLFFEGVKNFKIVTRKYNLNDLDISTLDPHKLVFDNQEYFIVMEVKNYTPGRISTVKLFKV